MLEFHFNFFIVILTLASRSPSPGPSRHYLLNFHNRRRMGIGPAVMQRPHYMPPAPCAVPVSFAAPLYLGCLSDSVTILAFSCRTRGRTPTKNGLLIFAQIFILFILSRLMFRLSRYRVFLSGELPVAAR